jgi:hypothetical protein
LYSNSFLFFIIVLETDINKNREGYSYEYDAYIKEVVSKTYSTTDIYQHLSLLSIKQICH